MQEIKTGDKVICGICGKETEVTIVTEREGVKAYDLKCWHRNADCPKCGALVRDASETVQEVHPHCEKCDGPFYDDDDEEDDE
jgi:hypothetical protein